MSEISFAESTASEVLERLHHSAQSVCESLSVGTASAQDTILVAQLDNEIVGYLAARAKRDGLMVWEHIVAPDFRDLGIGRRLLLEAAKRTAPMSRLTIDPSGDFAIGPVAAYYGRLGFPSVPDDEFKISVLAYEVVDTIGERLEEDTTLEAILRRKREEVVTVQPQAPISEAVALLNNMGVGSIVVSSDGSHIDGVLSERDIVVGLYESGTAFLESRVQQHMTSDVVSVDVTDIIADVMELMTNERRRHLPVTAAGKLVGVVSVGDLLVFRMREHDMRRDVLPYRTQP